MKGSSLFSIVLLLLCLPASVNAFDHNHVIFDRLLKDIVVVDGHQSQVRYQRLIDKPRVLEAYLAQISRVSRVEYETWSRQQKMAFLINAYNGFTRKLILSRYPQIKSIKELGSFFSSPWEKKFFILFGTKHHLDYIEHERLRKDFRDPRIHFAIVCAAVSCPPLAADA